MILTTTRGIYCGSKTGVSKVGEQWLQLRFKVHETYRGCLIPPTNISQPNLMVFPPEGFSLNFQKGAVYDLQLGVGATMRNGSAYPFFDLHRATLVPGSVPSSFASDEELEEEFSVS